MADSAVIIKTGGLMRWRWRFTEAPDKHMWPIGQWVSGRDPGSRYTATDDACRDARRLTADLPRNERWASIEVWLVSADDRLTRLVAQYRLEIVNTLGEVA